MAPPAGRPQRRWEIELVRVPAASILFVIAAVAAAAVLRSVFVSAHRVLGWALAALVVAVLLDPVVEWLSRRLPRWLSVVLCVIVIVGVVASLWAGVFTNLRSEVDDLKTRAPAAAAELEAKYQWAREFRLEERTTNFVSAVDERVGGGEQVLVSASRAVPTYIVAGILMLFFLAYGNRFLFGLLRAAPEHRRRRWAAVIADTLRHGRGYVLTAIVEAAAVATVSYSLFRLLGIDAAFLLALIAGAIATVPYIGIVLGYVPALLLTAGLRSAAAAFVVLGVAVLLQTAEIIFLRPYVDRATVRVGPAIIIVVTLLGLQLYGAGGAVYASVLAVFLLAFVDAVTGDEPAVDDPPEAEVPADRTVSR